MMFDVDAHRDYVLQSWCETHARPLHRCHAADPSCTVCACDDPACAGRCPSPAPPRRPLAGLDEVALADGRVLDLSFDPEAP